MRKQIRGQGGFTLIEIIAVLIILGILALIAIPKYQDIVNEARDAAANQAIAEGIARVNQAYASCLMATNGTQASCDTIGELNTGGFINATSGGTGGDDNDLGDYTVTYTDVSDCTVTYSASEQGGGSGSASKTADFCVN